MAHLTSRNPNKRAAQNFCPAYFFGRIFSVKNEGKDLLTEFQYVRVIQKTLQAKSAQSTWISEFEF